MTDLTTTTIIVVVIIIIIILKGSKQILNRTFLDKGKLKVAKKLVQYFMLQYNA